MTPVTIEELFAKTRQLPVVPRVLQELLLSFNNTRLRTDDLAQLILSDPVICSRLLRLANSARYHAPQAVSTVHQAVQMLGLVNVRSLVISMGLVGSFANLPVELLRPFWQHSLHTATLARCWASHPQLDAELAYTLGLLRGLGQLVMRLGLGTEMRTLDAQVEPFSPARLQLERELLGYNYADVGAELVHRWDFPALFAQVIGLVGTGVSEDSAVPGPNPAQLDSHQSAEAAQSNSHVASLAALIELAAWQAWASQQQLSADELAALWPVELAQRLQMPAWTERQHLAPESSLDEVLQDLLTWP